MYNAMQCNVIWLVVLTILNNISQWEGLSHVLWKNNKCLKPPTSNVIYVLVSIEEANIHRLRTGPCHTRSQSMSAAMASAQTQGHGMVEQ